MALVAREWANSAWREGLTLEAVADLLKVGGRFIF